MDPAVSVGPLFSELFPGTDRSYWLDIYQKVVDTQTPQSFEDYWPPIDRWLAGEASPGGGERFYIIYRDVTVRKRAEMALRESENRFREVLNSMIEGFALFDADFTILEVNDATVKLDGRSRDELVGRSHWEAFPGSEYSPVGQMFKQVMRERTPGALEHVYRWPSGREMWIDVRAYPNADGRVACFSRDITEQKAATDALYKSQERQAFLLKVSDALRPLADPTDIQNAASRFLVESLEVLRAGFGELEGDEIVVRADHSPRAGSIVGRYSVDDFGPTLARIYREGGAVVLRDAATDTMISDVERSLYASLNIAAHVTVATSSAGQPVIALGVQSEAPRDWSDADIALIKDVAERAWAAVVRARAEQALRESERHAHTLLAELQHRVRNTLAVIRSIARRTAENSDSVEEMLGHFQGRIDAFSRVQATLTRSADATVDLASLIEDEMVAHAAKEGEQVSISGPDLNLDPRTAERLSLAIHELTTNAVKHGVFVTSHGRVKIRWTKEVGNDFDVLALEWTESGVTIDPSAMRRSGFGMELLQRSLPYDLRGETSVEFRPDGVHFELRMPLPPATDRSIGAG